MLLCYYVTNVTMLLCYYVTVVLCYDFWCAAVLCVTMLLCYYVTMLLCYYVTVVLCYDFWCAAVLCCGCGFVWGTPTRSTALQGRRIVFPETACRERNRGFKKVDGNSFDNFKRPC